MAGYIKDICVIGMGRFGHAVVEQLIELKRHVLALDSIEDRLIKISRITKTAIVNGADVEGLRALGLAKFNTVIVAAADNIEIVASLMEIGVNHIIAKAISVRHARVLKQIGVDVIIRPEYESGIRAALIATSPNFIKYSELLHDIGDDHTMGSTKVNSEKWLNIPLKDLMFNKHNVSVVFLKRDDEVIIPTGDLVIHRDDQITLIGKTANIVKIFAKLNDDSVTREQDLRKARNAMKEK